MSLEIVFPIEMERVLFKDKTEHFFKQVCSYRRVFAVKYADRATALTQKQKAQKILLPFVTQFQPSLPGLKNILMEKWHLIENQPLLREIFKEPPLISYRKGKSLKDMLVKAKL